MDGPQQYFKLFAPGRKMEKLVFILKVVQPWQNLLFTFNIITGKFDQKLYQIKNWCMGLNFPNDFRIWLLNDVFPFFNFQGTTGKFPVNWNFAADCSIYFASCPLMTTSEYFKLNISLLCNCLGKYNQLIVIFIPFSETCSSGRGLKAHHR